MIDRRIFLGGAVAGLAGLSGALPAAAKTFSGVNWGSGRLDIYAPANAQNAPVAVYVHGGAWAAGSKGSVGSMPSWFNSQGWVFVSTGYTLYPRANVERQAREVAGAFNWVRSNIGRYGGDGSRVALMGHSAGCHLACLASLSGMAQGVRALVANDTAAYDLAYLAEINNDRLPVLYAAPFSDRSKWRNWSPISYAGGGGFPVMVAWSGGKDRARISQRFADRLAASGRRVVRFDGSRYSHISIRSAMGRRGDALNSAITNFLTQTV
jgi:acetyl esterase/lipase